MFKRLEHCSSTLSRNDSGSARDALQVYQKGISFRDEMSRQSDNWCENFLFGIIGLC
jgi:hypothetical protein